MKELTKPLKHYLSSELFLIGGLSLLFLFSFYNVIITGEKVFVHDSFQWYGLFQFFAESIYNGYWPFWNPYTHTGEPFYFNYIQKQYLHPIKLVSVYIGKMINADIMTLYYWTIVLQLLFTNLGIYLFLRRFTRYSNTRIFIFIVINFSAFSIISMRLLGLLEIMFWAPWIFYVLFRIIDEKESYFNWLMLATLIGLSLTAYGIVYYVTFLFFLFISFFFFNREALTSILFLFKRENYRLLIMVIFVVFSLSSPLWATVLFDMDKIYPVARTLDHISKGFIMSVDEMKKAEEYWRSAVVPYDLLSLANPFHHYDFLINAKKMKYEGALLTESLLYIGILPFMFGIYGIFCCRDKYKPNFIVMAGSLFLIMMGTSFFFYIFVCYVFPVIRFQRHPMQFIPFFLITIYYFSAIGFDTVQKKYHEVKEKISKDGKSVNSFYTLSLIVLMSFAGIWLLYVTYEGKQVGASLSLYFLLFLLTSLLMFSICFKKGKYLMVSVFLFLIVDLLAFNLAYRPLMLQNRPENLMTHAVKPDIQKQGKSTLGGDVPVERYKSLVTRTRSLEIDSSVVTSTFFQLIMFHNVSVMPQKNIDTISGMINPPLFFYNNVEPFNEQRYIDTFLNDSKTEHFKKKVYLFNTEGVPEELLEGKERDIIKAVIELIHYNPNQMKFVTKTSETTFLYFSDGYDNYWNAKIDSKPVNVYQANINYKGVVLPKGIHTVSFEYYPVFHIVSLYIYFFMLFFISVIFFGYLYC
ncbi:MAG: YfhO family protein, partial [Nitrospinae bacterium]|nr:YfhO family protein [Nitrospinota bacterium]